MESEDRSLLAKNFRFLATVKGIEGNGSAVVKFQIVARVLYFTVEKTVSFLLEILFSFFAFISKKRTSNIYLSSIPFRSLLGR